MLEVTENINKNSYGLLVRNCHFTISPSELLLKRETQSWCLHRNQHESTGLLKGLPNARDKSLEVVINATATRRKKLVFDLSLNSLLSLLGVFVTAKLRSECSKLSWITLDRLCLQCLTQFQVLQTFWRTLDSQYLLTAPSLAFSKHCVQNTSHKNIILFLMISMISHSKKMGFT